MAPAGDRVRRCDAAVGLGDDDLHGARGGGITRTTRPSRRPSRPAELAAAWDAGRARRTVAAGRRAAAGRRDQRQADAAATAATPARRMEARVMTELSWDRRSGSGAVEGSGWAGWSGAAQGGWFGVAGASRRRLRTGCRPRRAGRRPRRRGPAAPPRVDRRCRVAGRRARQRVAGTAWAPRTPSMTTANPPSMIGITCATDLDGPHRLRPGATPPQPASARPSAVVLTWAPPAEPMVTGSPAGVVTVTLRVDRTATSTTCRPSGVTEIVALRGVGERRRHRRSASAALSPIGSRPTRAASWSPLTVGGTAAGSAPGVIGSDRYCTARCRRPDRYPTDAAAAVPEIATSPAVTVIDSRPSPAERHRRRAVDGRAGTTEPSGPRVWADRHRHRDGDLTAGRGRTAR